MSSRTSDTPAPSLAYTPGKRHRTKNRFPWVGHGCPLSLVSQLHRRSTRYRGDGVAVRTGQSAPWTDDNDPRVAAQEHYHERRLVPVVRVVDQPRGAAVPGGDRGQAGLASAGLGQPGELRRYLQAARGGGWCLRRRSCLRQRGGLLEGRGRGVVTGCAGEERRARRL